MVRFPNSEPAERLASSAWRPKALLAGQYRSTGAVGGLGYISLDAKPNSRTVLAPRQRHTLSPNPLNYRGLLAC